MGKVSSVFRTLRGRLTLLACLATLPAFLFVIYVATQERRMALGRAENEAHYVASLASREHSHQVAAAQSLLRRLMELPSKGGSGNLENLQHLLPTLLSGFPQIANLGILTPEGALAFSVIPPLHPVDMRDNPAFEGALQSRDVVLGRYQIGQIVGRPVLILALALRDGRERILGVLFAALDLEWLDGLAAQAKLPPEYALLILDREGRVLARSEGPGRRVAEEGDLLPGFAELLRPGTKLVRSLGLDRRPRLFTAAPLEGLGPVPKPPRAALGAPGGSPQERRDEHSGSTRFEPDAAGSRPPPQPGGTTPGGRSAASAPLTYEPHGPAGPFFSVSPEAIRETNRNLRSIPPDVVAARGGFGTGPLADLHVAVGLPEDHMTGMANRAFLRAILALALLTLLTVASSITAADLSVLRDLRLVARATRRFGAGDMTTRTQVPSAGGEIQDLALAFNAMADALELRDQEATAARDQLRALSHRLQEAREEEGARISRELHDQLGQELTTLKLELAGMKRKSPVQGSQEALELRAWLDQIGAQIDGCVDSIRRISSELHPSVLDRLGLVPALEWLTKEFERRTGLCCTFSARGPRRDLDRQVSTALFRITQEALTNVLRHAEAHSVRVNLDTDGPDLVLRIEDDGRGFHGEVGTLSLGILGMQERARLVGGAVAISGVPGEGTSVVARVPRSLEPS